MERIIRLITENPHRMAGVFANAPTKEILANESMALAYSKVGKEAVFPTDLTCVMPPLTRDAESVREACARLSVPGDRLAYAQFWFLRTDGVDAEAMRLLASGDMDGAVRLWGRHETVSSLQNRMLCHLLQQDLPTAVSMAESLYGRYADTYLSTIGLADEIQMADGELQLRFVELLCRETDPKRVFDCCRCPGWKEDIRSGIVKSASDDLLREVEQFRNSDHSDAESLISAGRELMRKTKDSLGRLREMLPKEDLQYQMMADKAGMAVLECCIEYYNSPSGNYYDKAHKIYGLLMYVKNTVVGAVARQRFEENYEMIQPLLQISRDDYERIQTAPRRRKVRWLVYLGIIVLSGVIMSVADGDSMNGFCTGLLLSMPLCIVVSKFMNVLEF